MAMTLTSTSFTEGGLIPEKYTCDGVDVSPQLAWEGVPEDTQSFVLICDDPDAPMIANNLADTLKTTRDTIARHERNLKKFQADERQIVTRFDGDVARFKILKGID